MLEHLLGWDNARQAITAALTLELKHVVTEAHNFSCSTSNFGFGRKKDTTPAALVLSCLDTLGTKSEKWRKGKLL